MKRRTFLQSVGAMSVLGFGAKEAASTPFITQGYYPTFFDELDIATKGLKRGSLTLITGAFCNSFGEVMRSQMLMRWAPKCIPYSNDTMPCPEPILGSCDRPIFGSLDRTGRLCHVANDCSASFHVFWRNYIGPMNIKVLFVSGGFGGNYSSRYLYWLIKNARKYNYALVFQHCRPMLWIQYESNLILNTGFDYVLIKKNNARISNERFIWDVRTTMYALLGMYAGVIMKNRNLPNKHEAKPKVKKALRRKLHFANNEIWTWEMRGRNISIRSPNGTIFKTDQSKIANVSRDELERASWKGYASQYAVTPSMVKDWINNQKEEK